MTRQELDKMFEKAELVSYDEVVDRYGANTLDLWWCNVDYEWVDPEWRDEEDMFRVVTMTPKEAEDWIGGHICGASWDIDFGEVAEQGLDYINVAKFEPRNATN